jgi:hypothetical protein
MKRKRKVIAEPSELGRNVGKKSLRIWNMIIEKLMILKLEACPI